MRYQLRFVALLCVWLIPSTVARAQDCSPWFNISKPSLVFLSVKKIQKNTGVVSSGNGSGFIVSPEGHVLTAYHVVAPDPDTEKVEILGVTGSIYATNKSKLEVVDFDPKKDIAILEFKDASRVYDFMQLGDPFKTAPGGPLCSFSFSEPLDTDFQSTWGTLGNKRGEDKTAGIRNLWTTQLPSNQGESGAPVIDQKNGGVVAMKYGGKDAQNVNLLIPLNFAKGMLDVCCNIKIPTPNVNNPSLTSEPLLLSVKVTFTTAGDNKAPDVAVGISVAAGGLLMAGGSGIAAGVEFGDAGNYGPYVLEGSTSRITKAMYRNSTVTIVISPQDERMGTINDRWITQVQLEATFSDSQILKTNSRPITLDNANRVIAFMNQ